MIRIMMLATMIALTPLANVTAHNHQKGAAAQPHNHDHHGTTGHEHAEGEHAGEGSEARAPTNDRLKAALAAGGELIVVDVLGVVCDFCATSMNKVFSKRGEVAATHVELNSKTLAIVTAKGRTLDDRTITSLVGKAGYKVAKVRRGADASAIASAATGQVSH